MYRINLESNLLERKKETRASSMYTEVSLEKNGRDLAKTLVHNEQRNRIKVVFLYQKKSQEYIN